MPVEIIIDTDPGVDDAAAILLALASPELTVLGVTVVAGNVGLEASVSNACKLLALAGRCDIPVHAGASRPLLRDQVMGKYAHIGVFSDQIVPPADLLPQRVSAISFIVDQARLAISEGRRITICAIGPLTNIALALRLDPDIAQGIDRIVVMGGAFATPGHRTPWSEYNIYADPHAAAIVFASGVPLTLFPLDVTLLALFTQMDLVELEVSDGPAGRALAGLLRSFDRSDIQRYGRPGGPIHDAMTIAFLLQPRLFTGADAAIGVTLCGPTAGQTWIDPYGKSGLPPNAVVMREVDEAAYRRLVTTRIARIGTPPYPIPEGRKIKA